jgi:SnoaL-like domain
MPTKETLERFIARVETNEHLRAIEEFYTEQASMQENQEVPRRGRASLVATEGRVMSRCRSVSSRCVRPVLVDEDHVCIRWVFEFEWLDGTSTRLEELAWQRWEGERIAEETFFYDPAQRRATRSS